MEILRGKGGWHEISTLPRASIPQETLPAAIGGWKKLRRLDLANNNLQEIPHEVSNAARREPQESRSMSPTHVLESASHFVLSLGGSYICIPCFTLFLFMPRRVHLRNWSMSTSVTTLFNECLSLSRGCKRRLAVFIVSPRMVSSLSQTRHPRHRLFNVILSFSKTPHPSHEKRNYLDAKRTDRRYSRHSLPQRKAPKQNS